MIYFYNRQSSDKQTLKNGETMLTNYMKSNKLSYENFKQIDEHASAFKYGWRNRKLGTEIISQITDKDILLITEVSRISRRLKDLLDFVDEVKKIGFKTIIMNNNLTLDNSPTTTIIIQVLGMVAEMEAKTLKERTKIGIERARREGKQIGRPKSTEYKPAKRKLDNYKDDIIKLLKLGVPKNKIAKQFNVCYYTLHKFIKFHKIII
jgi:putative DNA-invertase from lambdoid prophage Rac